MKPIFLRPKGALFTALLVMTFVISGAPTLFAGNADKGTTEHSIESTTAVEPTKWVYGLHPQGDLNIASPALADMNGNGTLDVVVATHDGRIIVVEGNSSGTVTTPIWEKDFSSAFGMSAGTQEFASSPAVADIDKDDLPEIVIGAGSSDPNKCTQGGVIVIEHNGDVKAGWPKFSNDFNGNGCKDTVYGTPALADLTGDGYLEIVVGGFDKRLNAWRYDGSSLPGFPV
ncbi:MAG: VCBS repeat-containing protein, partial [Anaerolineales bacterium]|nr:VCBS repeat-containing protein [Anaerolineales bacterium]